MYWVSGSFLTACSYSGSFMTPTSWLENCANDHHKSAWLTLNTGSRTVAVLFWPQTFPPLENSCVNGPRMLVGVGRVEPRWFCWTLGFCREKSERDGGSDCRARSQTRGSTPFPLVTGGVGQPWQWLAEFGFSVPETHVRVEAMAGWEIPRLRDIKPMLHCCHKILNSSPVWPV